MALALLGSGVAGPTAGGSAGSAGLRFRMGHWTDEPELPACA